MFDTNKRLKTLKISIRSKLRNKWAAGMRKGRFGSGHIGYDVAGNRAGDLNWVRSKE